ncbi:transmembrane protein 51a isoform X2 [Conger conger]|nr:transmembrane protein 51a isoform X2 [Conger conger]
MCSGGQLCSGSGRPPPGSAGDNAHNSGSQYALCALGVGLVALGVVMIVWSVVPSNVTGNSSKPGSGSGSGNGNGNMHAKANTSSVAFVLAGVGVAMLLLSVCLGVRSKRRQQRRETQAEDSRLGGRAADGQEVDTEEAAARYDVPTYEEAVGSGQYPVQPGPLPSSSSASQLPSYEDLVDGEQLEVAVPGPSAGPQPPQPQASSAGAAPAPPEPQPSRQNGVGRMLRPLKVRRIKSEKLRLKNVSGPPQVPPLSIEPLTPPPQYEDQMPRL